MYLEVYKQEERFGLCYWSLNDREKGTTATLNSHKLTSKLYLLFSEIAVQEN